MELHGVFGGQNNFHKVLKLFSQNPFMIFHVVKLEMSFVPTGYDNSTKPCFQLIINILFTIFIWCIFYFICAVD
jgi:hypothetical protein